ncbi:unnamed protein product [Sphagnum balticum]
MNSTQKEPTPKLARPNALHKKQMETDDENPRLGLPKNTSLRSTSTEQQSATPRYEQKDDNDGLTFLQLSCVPDG